MRRSLRKSGPRSTISRVLIALAASLLVLGSLASLAPEAAFAAPKSRFTPARKFQRGITNTTLGILAIPGQMTVQTRERGAAAGLPLGFAMGLGWFVASELVGVWELLTCPFPFPEGYKPILEPEFPWQYFEDDRPASRRRPR
jgi:putative exosortase-associated protein (TIGR04073 family)